MPKSAPKTETSHFWVGEFATRQAAEKYLAEQYEDDDAPVSEFTRDQGVNWYDHDFMESSGFSKAPKPIQMLAKGHSYHEQWAEELARRAKDAGLTSANLLIFISKDQIKNAKSVKGNGYSLNYLGTIEYRIDLV
jgi:hypothetical protein